MSANWRVGKVEKVKLGADGCVRQVTITYTDTSADNPEDWLHRTVDRPVRNIVKISHIDETSFMEDINDVHNLSEKIMNPEEVLQGLDSKPEADVRSEHLNEAEGLNVDDQEATVTVDDDYEQLDEEEVPPHVPVSVPKLRKKRRTELENLKITLKGWNLAMSVSQALPFTCSVTQLNMMNVHKDAVDGCDEQGNKGQIREGEDEDADREFNFVMKNDNDFDEMYLL